VTDASGFRPKRKRGQGRFVTLAYRGAVFVHEAVVWVALPVSCALGVIWILRQRTGVVRSAWFWVDTILTGVGLGVGGGVSFSV
jgi:hypothetical protein